MNLQLKDRADMFYTLRQPGPDTQVHLVTIDRPDRDHEHRRTYDLSTRTPASRERLARLLQQDWPTRQATPTGWLGVSSLDTRRPLLTTADRLALLEDAHEGLQQVIATIRKAISGTDMEARAESYILPSLRMCLDDHHSYLGGQPCNIEEMIQALNGDLALGDIDW